MHGRTHLSLLASLCKNQFNLKILKDLLKGGRRWYMSTRPQAVWNSRSTLIMRVTFRCSCRLQETLNERNAPIAIRNGETKDNAQLGHSNATKNYGLTKGIAYRGTTINYPSVHYRTLRPWHKPPTHAFWKSCSTNSGWSFWAASDFGHLADCAVNPTLRPKPNEARWIPASTAFTRLAQALTPWGHNG